MASLEAVALQDQAKSPENPVLLSLLASRLITRLKSQQTRTGKYKKKCDS